MQKLKQHIKTCYGHEAKKGFALLLGLLIGSTWLLAQEVRENISLDHGWRTAAADKKAAYSGFEKTTFKDAAWKKVDVPHNWDRYEGYRRKLHGNRHGSAFYRKSFRVPSFSGRKRLFLFFEGVGSYATVFLNGKRVGTHAGGRTSFTIDITPYVKLQGENLLAVQADHPAGIKDLPWVCGGCSDERGFSEGSQPMGIFRPVHLVITNEVRIEPFGVHIWNDTTVSEKKATLQLSTEIRNYSAAPRNITVVQKLMSREGKTVSESRKQQILAGREMKTLRQVLADINRPTLWSVDHPYLYTLQTEIFENGKQLDLVTTSYGIRQISWPLGKPASSNRFLLNGKPVFINGIAEYEHQLGGSHAFTAQQIYSRVMQMKAAGFNAFREAHHPHNLRYQQHWDSLGFLLWTQMGAHIWYDTPAFRQQFKQLLKEWVRERRNSPSVVLWGLQNESKLPEDFARECTELIRQLDPTASSQRLVVTCNGGKGTDWDVPQNWTGTYGGNPMTYAEDLKRQVLVGEYGAWRTIDLHTEGPFVQNGMYSEDRMTRLMEMKLQRAELARDSSSGHFMWLFTSHDNPGRVQGGEGYRELDRIGPVNYKGLLTPWEEPLDVYYMYRSNYAPKETEPMVYIVSHTWAGRWTDTGIKNGIVVYSNCDEVELFNDEDGHSLGRQKNRGRGSHFRWDSVPVLYNLLLAKGYVHGKLVAEDRIVLDHLPASPNFSRLYPKTPDTITAPQPGYHYLYRVNCGGPSYKDQLGHTWLADRPRTTANTWGSRSWTNEFPGLPPFFASQRRISDPIKGTSDWPLFQTFRYGREQLRYEFPLPDGEYLVELFFTEPWLGTGGGMNATGWRSFDVAINDQTVLKELDIWKEAGHDQALKKSVRVKIKGGLLTVHFPKIYAGQAIVSAIAIASANQLLVPAPSPQPLMILHAKEGWTVEDWLHSADEMDASGKEKFHRLPPQLYGAQWIKTKGRESFEGDSLTTIRLSADVDLFAGIDTAFSGTPSWMKGFEALNLPIVTDKGRQFTIYRRRMKAGSSFTIYKEGMINHEMYLLMATPASTMEPAYDLKTVAGYKAVAAVLSGPGLVRGKVDGKDRVIFEKASAENFIEWHFTLGVADIYSLTVSYNNPTARAMQGQLQFLSADGTLMKEEAVVFTPTRAGKSNYITTNTGSMVNAGNYIVRLRTKEAAGLSVNALDVQ